MLSFRPATDEDWPMALEIQKSGFLDLVVLHPLHQGRGLGRAVMRHRMAEAQGRGVRLELSVYKINPARQLYLRLGFIEHPRDDLRVRMVWEQQG